MTKTLWGDFPLPTKGQVWPELSTEYFITILKGVVFRKNTLWWIHWDIIRSPIRSPGKQPRPVRGASWSWGKSTLDSQERRWWVSVAALRSSAVVGAVSLPTNFPFLSSFQKERSRESWRIYNKNIFEELDLSNTRVDCDKHCNALLRLPSNQVSIVPVAKATLADSFQWLAPSEHSKQRKP